MGMLDDMTAGISWFAEHVEILPAVGEAAQDLLRPSEEELEDQLRCQGDDTLGADETEIFETSIPPMTNPFRATPALPRRESHLIRYFLDGSAHGRAVGTGLEATRSFPVQLFQLGAGLVTRNDDGDLYPTDLRRKVILTVQVGAGGLSDSLWQLLKPDEQKDSVFETVDIRPNQSSRKDIEDIRARSNSIAFHRMHDLELNLCDMLRPLLNESCRAVLDGSVKIGKLVENPFVIGLAKSFWHMPKLKLKNTGTRPLNLVRLLTALPLAHRTPVFQASGGNVGFWYVRLRPAEEGYSLQGVVKVEIPRPSREPVDSHEADLLSRAIVAERCVTAYGLDRRWASMIYPIHFAEQMIKYGFMSEAVLDRIIRKAIRRYNPRN